MRCKHATTRSAPLPEVARGISAMQLEELGRRAAQAGAARLRKKLGVNDLEVDCKYLGASTTSGPPDLDGQVAHDNSLVYEWSLRFGREEEKERVTVRCDNAEHRGVPLPKLAGAGKRFIAAMQLEKLEKHGRHAAQAGTTHLRKKLGVRNLEVDWA